MAGERFQTIDLSACLRALAELHEQVTRGHCRVQITRLGCEDVCVLISQAELDALERALEIFAQTDGYQAMCGELTEAAGQSTAALFSAPVAP